MNNERHQLQLWAELHQQRPDLWDEQGNAIPAEPYKDGDTVKDPFTPTIRNDGGKLRVDLLPIRPIEQVAQVLSTALSKYPERNWESGMAWSRCYASALRHLFAWWRGENVDPQSGLSHLAHAACNIIFILEYQERNRGTDDRPK